MTRFDDVRTTLYEPRNAHESTPRPRATSRRRATRPNVLGFLKDLSVLSIQTIAVVSVLRWGSDDGCGTGSEPSPTAVGSKGNAPPIGFDDPEPPKPVTETPAPGTTADATKGPGLIPKRKLKRKRKRSADHAEIPKDRNAPMGTLGVSHGPDASPARLSIDGRDHGYTPVITKVTAGKHRVRLAWPDGKILERVIVVKQGETVKSIGLGLSSGSNTPLAQPPPSR